MVELKIGGMSCQRCVQAVKDALEGVEGVDGAASVELESGRAHVEGRTDPTDLMAAVQAAGYEVVLISSQGSAE